MNTESTSASRRPRLRLFLGAGLSVASGLPAFRMGQGAIWQGWNMAEVSNLLTWQANYDQVHAFYNGRRADLGAAVPNAAHRAIAAWQQAFDTAIVTTNIDDLLERAGCTDVLHVHGLLTEVTCTACTATWSVGYDAVDPAAPCPRCGAGRALKPAVIFDEEDAPLYPAMDAVFRLDVMDERDVAVVIGSSGYSIAHEFLLWRRPGLKLLNNLEPSPHIDERLYTRVLYEPVVEALGALEAAIRAHLDVPTA